MTKIILSICIPTYDRPVILANTIKQIITFQSDEIEIIISDDNPISNRTEEVINKIKDNRIKYFRNKNNLGFDANQLLTIARANGEFIFLLMDDDEIEIDSLPWIINTIKNNKKLTYIYGSLGDERLSHNIIHNQIEDKILYRGFKSLNKFLFLVAHGSGIILRKSVLDLNKAKKYIGFLYIQQALVAQALISGDSMYSSKFFAYFGEHSNIIGNSRDQDTHHPPIFKKKQYWTPLGHLIIARYRLQIILDITENMKNSKRIRQELINKQKRYIYVNFHEALLDSFKSFLEGLHIVITMKQISKSPIFWLNLIVEILYHFFKSKFYKKYRPFRNVYIPVKS